MSRAVKTEHAGAKNGGGYWGRRVVAKARCRSLRRAHDRLLAAITCDHSRMHTCCTRPSCGHYSCPCGVSWDEGYDGQ